MVCFNYCVHCLCVTLALSRLALARLLIGQISPGSGLSLAAISHSVWEYLLMHPLIKSLFVSIWSMTAPMFPSSLVLRAATHVNWCLKSHNRAHFNTLWRILSPQQIKKHSLTKIKSNALIFLLPGTERASSDLSFVTNYDWQRHRMGISDHMIHVSWYHYQFSQTNAICLPRCHYTRHTPARSGYLWVGGLRSQQRNTEN